MLDVIMEALVYRGFSDGEADNMLARIMTYGPDADIEARVEPVLPFGKYRGCSVGEAPLVYLNWLLSQEWVKENYRDLYRAILERLGYGNR